MTDDCLMNCQNCETFMRSCQPRAPAVQPLPPCFTQGFVEPPPAAGQLTTLRTFGVPHDLLWCDLSANMFSGYMQTVENPSPEVNVGKSGLQQVTFRSAACVVCMCVPVSSSIWVKCLQSVKLVMTTGLGNVQTIYRSNDNVIAGVIETIRICSLIPSVCVRFRKGTLFCVPLVLWNHLQITFMCLHKGAFPLNMQ